MVRWFAAVCRLSAKFWLLLTAFQGRRHMETCMDQRLRPEQRCSLDIPSRQTWISTNSGTTSTQSYLVAISGISIAESLDVVEDKPGEGDDHENDEGDGDKHYWRSAHILLQVAGSYSDLQRDCDLLFQQGHYFPTFGLWDHDGHNVASTCRDQTAATFIDGFHQRGHDPFSVNMRFDGSEKNNLKLHTNYRTDRTHQSAIHLFHHTKVKIVPRLIGSIWRRFDLRWRMILWYLASLLRSFREIKCGYYSIFALSTSMQFFLH